MPGWLSFVLSYFAGLFGLWGGLALAINAAFGAGEPSIWMLYGMPLVIAVCVFALAYMALSRRVLKLGFWALALGLTTLIAGLVFAIVFQGTVTPLEGAIIAVAVHFWASSFLMRKVW